jgi:hypothetical protein
MVHSVLETEGCYEARTQGDGDIEKGVAEVQLHGLETRTEERGERSTW